MYDQHIVKVLNGISGYVSEDFPYEGPLEEVNLEDLTVDDLLGLRIRRHDIPLDIVPCAVAVWAVIAVLGLKNCDMGVVAL